MINDSNPTPDSTEPRAARPFALPVLIVVGLVAGIAAFKPAASLLGFAGGAGGGNTSMVVCLGAAPGGQLLATSQAQTAGDSDLFFDQSTCGGDAIFTVETTDGSELRDGSQVSIKSRWNTYVSAQQNGAVYANRTGVGAWEIYAISRNGGQSGDPIQPGDQVEFSTFHGTNLALDANGVLKAEATATPIAFVSPPADHTNAMALCLRTDAGEALLRVPSRDTDWGEVTVDGHSCADDALFTLTTLNGMPLGHGEQVTLRSSWGRYFGAHSNGDVNAKSTTVGGWETFTLLLEGGQVGDRLYHGDRFTLQTVHGTHIGATSGVIAASGPGVDAEKTMTALAPAVMACLRSRNLRFIGVSEAEAQSDSSLRTQVKDTICDSDRDAMMAIESVDGTALVDGADVTIRTRWGTLLSAQGDGTFQGNRTAAASWEIFRISLVGGQSGDPIEAGDDVSFTTDHGTYMWAVNGGDQDLRGAGSLGASEIFRLVGRSSRRDVCLLAVNDGALASISQAQTAGGDILTDGKYCNSGETRFIIETLEGGELVSGAEIAIRTAWDTWLSAQPHGAIEGNRGAVGSWEMFTITVDGAQAGDPIPLRAPVRIESHHGTYLGGAGGALRSDLALADSNSKLEVTLNQPGLDMSNREIDTDWSFSNLEGADFTGATFIVAMGQQPDRRFNGANLAGVDLRGMDLRYTNLENANLANANLSGNAKINHTTKLKGVDFTGANLTDVNLRGPLSPNSSSGAAGIRFTGANLVRADLSSADLMNLDFSGANLHSAKLHGANLTGAVMTGVVMNGAEIAGSSSNPTRFSGVDFTGAKLEDVWFAVSDGVVLDGMILDGALCPNGRFEGETYEVYSHNHVYITVDNTGCQCAEYCPLK